MNGLLTVRDSNIDVQGDAYLASGAVTVADGPDRAWLQYTNTKSQGNELVEDAALWLLDTRHAVDTLARCLGAPTKGGVVDAGWRVTWIVDGQVVRRALVSFDQAIFLIEALAPQNLLDYDAHLFGA